MSDMDSVEKSDKLNTVQHETASLVSSAVPVMVMLMLLLLFPSPDSHQYTPVSEG